MRIPPQDPAPAFELPKTFFRPEPISSTYVKKPLQLLPLPGQSEADLKLPANQPRAHTQFEFVSGQPVELEMTAEQAEKLKQLLRFAPEELKETLRQLASQPAASPRLLAHDKNGSTVLDQLHRLLTAPARKPEIDPRQVLRELIPRLNQRSVMFQGPQYTCGSAAAQNWLLGNDPGEFTRILTDLTLSGSSKLRDKTSISLPPDLHKYLAKRDQYSFNHGKDKDTRAVCDVLFQSAVMQDISLVGGNRAWKGKGDNLLESGLKTFAWLTDWAGYDVESDDVGIMTKLAGNGGGDPFLLTSLLKAMTQKDFELTNPFEGKSELKQKLTQMHSQKQEMLCLYKSPLHYVLVTDYDPVKKTVTCLSTGTSSSSAETFSLDAFLAKCGALIGQ